MQLRKLFIQSIFWRSAYFLSVLILNIFIARYFTSSGSASIYFLSTVYAFIILLGGLSLESGMGFYASNKQVPANAIFYLGLAWATLVAVVSLIIFYFYGEKLGGHNFPPALILFSAATFIFGNLLSSYSYALFYAQNNFYIPNLIGVAGNVFLIVLILLTGTSVLPGFSLEDYLYIYFGMFFFQGLALSVSVQRLISRSWVPEFPVRSAFYAILKYSLTAYLANILFMLVSRIDYWFIDRFCSKHELGNYIQVSKLSQLLVLVPSFFASAIFPIVASGRKEEVFRGLAQLTRLSLLLIGIACVGIGATGNFFFPLLFGKSFQLMTLPFILLIPGILALAALYPLSAYYSGKNMIGVNIRGCFLALVFIIVGDLIFIPLFGINGGAAVSSVGYSLYYAYMFFVFRKEYDVSFKAFFLLRRSDLAWLQSFLSKSRKA